MRRQVIDRMALLCTLHADGPKTLRLLREAGCASLEKLPEFGADRLARLLSLSPASARRLLREAKLLRERLEGTLEREEVMYPPSVSAAAVKPAPPGAHALESSTPEESVSPPAGSRRATLDLRDRALVDQVIDRWRTDERHAEAASELPQEIEEPETFEDEVASPHSSEGLQVRDLAGLDEESCARLRAAGIHSLEELATCPIDELSVATGLSFTRARTLQFLAGRALSGASSRAASFVPRRPPPKVEPRTPSEPKVAAEDKLSLASPSRAIVLEDRFGSGLQLDEGVGGPFA